MALTAQSIVQRAVQVLQDSTSVRWTVDELVRWLNDGQREVILYRPDANSKVSTGTLIVGSRQDMTTMTGVSNNNPAKLIRAIRNMAATSLKKAVRLVEREILDAQQPGWHNLTGSVDVVHYIFDEEDPRAFYVYPPATALAQLELVYSAYPVDVAVPASGGDFTTVTGNISIADIYGNVLLDYILYRAYLKDSEFAGNVQRAIAYQQSYGAALGLEIKGTFAVSPNMTTTYNPNAGKRAA